MPMGSQPCLAAVGIACCNKKNYCLQTNIQLFIGYNVDFYAL